MTRAPFDRAQFIRSTWPRRGPKSRLDGRCEPILNPSFAMASDDTVFAIGSCFARNIELYLTQVGLTVTSTNLTFPQTEIHSASRPNDLLLKYTPGSIHAEVAAALDPDSTPDPARLMLGSDAQGYFDMQLPTGYPRVSWDRALDRRQQITDLYTNLKTTRLFILTLGLVEHWFDTETETYIAAAPPETVAEDHPGRFEFRRLGFADNFALIDETMGMIRAVNPDIRTVLTTSPVPLHKTFTQDDVITANAYSKSVLRAVAGEVADRHDNTDYFPSYEMVTLSPSDSAWESDLRHVRNALIGTVTKAFVTAYFPDHDTTATQDGLARYIKAQELYDAGDIPASLALYATLETEMGHDTQYLQRYCSAAVQVGDATQACRLADLLLAAAPGDWPRILKAQGLMLDDRPAEAIEMLRAARTHPQTLLHAGGWQMEAGRLAQDPQAEREGAQIVARAILDAHASPTRKPWMVRRMRKILARDGDTALLHEVDAFIAAR